MTIPKLLIIGYARHGKDTVCEILRDKYGLSFESSSMACAKIFIFKYLSELLGYKTVEECYEDRHNHRALWYQLIRAYSYNDKTKLSRTIFKDYDIYCGLRNREELVPTKDQAVADYVVWVDAMDRVGCGEESDSCTVGKADANIILDNNGTLEELHKTVDTLAVHLGLQGVDNASSN